ncbi:MAG: hypothetical protein AMQ22_00108 [Candidatus Methanofastidiosum methylothiophilum]|uniref:Uncharacterized protein n=1 Tax=Candidatus Methanofastidiosum methylothiophilum TaxID=1705564 RepID=A0A150J946_9EURY|nr:MAG: hypothetical protein AMQ22_00108 [Candidatus Methanofastidiosum methylthiophilus]
MRKVEALPYTVEEGIKKVVTTLNKANIEYYTAGREIYINEDLLLNQDLEGEDRTFIQKIKDYLRNEIEADYAILSFDTAPKGSYIIIEYNNYATFSSLAKIFSLRPEDEVIEEKHFPEIKDTKIERELDIINRDISGEDYEFEEEDDEEDYDYINFGERNCKVCGSVIRRVTVHDKDGKIRDGYKCVNTNCLKIYIIR